MQIDTGFLTQIFWIILILAVVWVVLRVVLKLAQRVFACGCGVILLIGLILVLVRYFRPS